MNDDSSDANTTSRDVPRRVTVRGRSFDRLSLPADTRDSTVERRSTDVIPLPASRESVAPRDTGARRRASR